ncbi:MAG: hypothetical protein SV966_16465 [Actinomycetota bacterium]|nr:hypothetical protein [Actinomycetota bacterium]
MSPVGGTAGSDSVHSWLVFRGALDSRVAPAVPAAVGAASRVGMIAESLCAGC